MMIKTIDTDSLLPPSSAALIMRVSKRRVQKLCEDGRIGFTIAGRYYIPKEEAKKFRPKPVGRPKSL